MAEGTDGILFTGEFDPSQFTAGIDAMIASTKKMQEEEVRLNKALADTETQLQENKKQLNDLFKAQQDISKSDTDRINKMKALTKQADDLRVKNDQLNATITKQKAELNTASASVKKMEDAYKSATAQVEKFNKEGGEIGANVSGTKLFGKLGEIKGKVSDTVGDLAKDLSSGGGIESALSGLGGAFGVFGSAAVAALVPLVLKIIELNTVESDAERQLRLTNESLKAFAEGSAKASADVDVMKIKFDLARQGLLDKDEVLKEYNNTLGKTLGVTKDFNEAEETLINNADTYIKIVGLKAQAQAIANLKIAESEKKIKAELNTEDNRNTITKVADYITSNELIPGPENEKRVAASRARFNNNIVSEADKNIQVLSEKEIEVQTALANLMFPFKDKPKEFEKEAKKQTRVIENIFEQELLKLRESIAKISASVFTDEKTITAAVEADFKKREAALDKALRKRQLTPGQLAILKDNLDQLQELTLEKDLKSFGEKQAAFLKRIDDAILTTQLESDRKRIETLQDRFERERQLIEFETEKTIVAVEAKRDKLIADVQKDGPANGLDKAAVQGQVDIITATYAALIEKLEAVKNQKLQRLAFETFRQLSENAKAVFDAGNLGVTEGTAIQIREQTDLYLAGKISYQQYQKELTNIARFEGLERLRLERLFLEGEIQLRRTKLATDKTLTDEQIKTLETEIIRLRGQLANNTSATAKAEGSGKNETGKKGKVPEWLGEMQQYVQAINTLNQTVLSFWLQAEEAEARALDRSIALQEKRVESARRIAERGNAEYLRLEEERLQELEIKRENNARRQLAVNAALQASQTLTALVSGIAQGAATGGPLGALIGLTAVIGAIVSGIAIAKSLQPQQPSFFVGTEDTGPGGKADNRGGFSATLHPHERVLTAEQNKKLKGISNEKLVELVNNSRWLIDHNYASRPLPSLNLAALDKANEVSNVGGIRLVAIMEENNRKLEENNQLHKRTHHLLKGMGVNVTMDKHGIAVSVLEAVDVIEKSKKI